MTMRFPAERPVDCTFGLSQILDTSGSLILPALSTKDFMKLQNIGALLHRKPGRPFAAHLPPREDHRASATLSSLELRRLVAAMVD